MATTIIILAAYIIGLIIMLLVVRKWDNPVIEKIFAVIFWPVILLLYGIYKIYMKLSK